RQMYKDELVLWEVERDLAKVERCQTQWAQPKLGKLGSPLPKPVIESVHEPEADGDENGDNDGSESDGKSAGDS
ncbi:hypothetical protein PAXRUDRAFT_165715, partial [Paxillus rubicundulus Ve08.2h10]